MKLFAKNSIWSEPGRNTLVMLVRSKLTTLPLVVANVKSCEIAPLEAKLEMFWIVPQPIAALAQAPSDANEPEPAP